MEELTKKMEARIMVLRNGGVGQSRLTRELVPGDIIILLGGVQVPADVRWIEGDQLQVDTAQLTGEGSWAGCESAARKSIPLQFPASSTTESPT